MAERTFGEGAKVTGGKYLLRWITDAPMFGRETTDRFIDRPLTDPDVIASKSRERLQILDGMPALPPRSAEWAAYFREWERFVMEFFASHSAWSQSVKSYKAGDLATAGAQLAQSKPEAVLRRYARLATRRDITPGEKALLVSMNLRWLPYIVSHRQALGLEAIRWKFEPTHDEPLAQLPGLYTFFLDRDQHLWRGWGEKETGQPCFAKSDTPEELSNAWLEAQKEFSVMLRCIMGEALLKGTYKARFFFVPAEANGTVNIILKGMTGAAEVTQQLQLRTLPTDRSGVVMATYPVKITEGSLHLGVKPVAGTIRLSAVSLEPAASNFE